MQCFLVMIKYKISLSSSFYYIFAPTKKLSMKLNLFVFLIFCFQISLAQEVNIAKLNDKIYEYNNNLEYKKSQDTLLHLYNTLETVNNRLQNIAWNL